MNRKNYGLPDFKLLIVTYILLAIGISMVYSASIMVSKRMYQSQTYFFQHQLIWAVFGTLFIIMLLNIDYHIYKKIARILILLSIVLLILVLIPGIGKKVSGSRSWIRIKGFGFQPAEFVKLFLIIYLAYIFSKKREKIESFSDGYLPTLIIVTTIFFLVLLQPDFGTGFIILVIAGGLAFISGVKLTYLTGTFFGVLPIAWFLISRVGYRKMRLIAFLNPYSDPMDKGYHIIQSIKSFRIGGLTGVGLGKGTQKLWYLPQPHTDFIFSVVGEELGFLGAFLIILLYIYLIFRISKIAMKTTDRFGFFITAGVGIMLSLEILSNIAVSVGLIPVTGLPLPFMSYGGSSLLVSMIGIGIVLNISRQIGDDTK